MKNKIIVLVFALLYPSIMIETGPTRTNLQKRITHLRLAQEALVEKVCVIERCPTKPPKSKSIITEFCPTKPPTGRARGSHEKSRLQYTVATLDHQNRVLRDLLKKRSPSSHNLTNVQSTASVGTYALSDEASSPWTPKKE